MSRQAAKQGDDPGREAAKSRPVRADAQRNMDALLEAALAVFATSGVDAPVREIAEKAGVGIGTVYRHFPQRADLVAAVFRHEIDACADAASVLAAAHSPGEALARWPPVNMMSWFPDSYTADFTLLAWPALIWMAPVRDPARSVTLCRPAARVNEPILAGVCIAWTGPPCDGASNLMMAVIAAATASTTARTASQRRWWLRRRPAGTRENVTSRILGR